MLKVSACVIVKNEAKNIRRWLACMQQAMRECQLDTALQARLADSFAHTADFMRNTNGY